MSEMIERVARSLCRLRIEQNRRWDKETLIDERMARAIDYAWKDFVDEARAAIVAMREPTLEMLDNGRRAAMSVQRSGVSGMTIDAQMRAECVRESAAWRAMIDTALSAPTPTKDQ